MIYWLRFAYFDMFYIVLPLMAAIVWYKMKRYRGTHYKYPLTSTIKHAYPFRSNIQQRTMFLIRMVLFFGLIFLIGKPQFVDQRTKLPVQGVDIMLVLDVSDSMQLPHHENDSRSRLEVAKKEAIRFINQRSNDPIGIVFFANDVISRCPLTLDKQMLRQIVDDASIDLLDHTGTLLSTALLAGINRLKRSKAASRIIILLTDGEPTRGDIDAHVPLYVAKELGIRVYTVGIGSEQEILIQHPFYGAVSMQTQLNKELLTKIAHETGGMFFEAKNQDDMRKIYETINRLEKTETEVPVFTHYRDFFIPVVWILLFVLLIELFFSSFIWFSV